MKNVCKKPGIKGEPHYLDNISDFFIQKFADRCQTQPNGCVFLQGNTQNTGYMNWWYRYDTAEETRVRYITAHRFSALTSGKFNEKAVNEYSVLHTCDQHYANNDVSYRQCVNPDHLWLGTAQDNIRDAMKKGRYVKPPVQIGADNFNAKLTEKQVLWVIKNHYKITQQKLGEILNVNTSTIEAIHRNITWRHLPR
jgi:hypothetical protein